MTTFKKLDEYLKDTDYSIINALSSAMRIKPSKAHQLLQDIDIQQETDLVYILDNDMTSNDEKTQLTHDFFQMLGLMEDENHFNGVDIVGDYNYKCMIIDLISRGVYMDWLEENSYEYLIDTHGRFAVKCDNRDMTYKAERASDACKKKVWLKDEIAKNIDPTERRIGMPIVKRAPLNDSASIEHSPFNTFKDKSSSASPFTDNTLDDEEFEESNEPVDKRKDLRDRAANIILHRQKNIELLKKHGIWRSGDQYQFFKKMGGEQKEYTDIDVENYGLKEGKKPLKRTIKKKNDTRLQNASKKIVGGENPAKLLNNPIYHSKTVKDKNKYNKKKERQSKITDESIRVESADAHPLTRLIALAGIENNNSTITESLSDAISDLAMEVVDGADFNTMAKELADEYGINVELLLRKFEEQHTPVETLINAKNNKADPSTRIDNAFKRAREYFTANFFGEPNEDVGKLFKFKNVDYAYIAYDGKKILGTRVDGVNGKEIWNFKGPNTINTIMPQIRK